MAWFRNHYHCPDCNTSWQDEWSCCCDDECPSCRKDYTPGRSEDLHVLHFGCMIMASPPTAEHGPDYQQIATCFSEKQAKLIAEALNIQFDLKELFK